MAKKKTTKVVAKPSKEVAMQKAEWSNDQIELIKNTVAKGSTNEELKLFLYVAKKTGLDPLTRQIHFVKRGAQMTIQTGIDGLRTIAERTKSLAGIDDAVYEEENGLPTKATVTVWRMVGGQRVAFSASARWDEYAPQGNQAFMWKKMPYLMLAKCAEALALRKAFPNDMASLYSDEEMHQAEKREVIVKEVSKIEVPKEPENPPFVSNDDEKLNLKKQITKHLKDLGESLDPKDVHRRVEEITQLALVEPNYLEIANRLSLLVEDQKQNGN